MLNEKKVLHVITSLNSGGAQAVLFALVCASQNASEHVVVNLSGNGKYSNLLKNEGIKVVDLKIKGIFSLIKSFFIFFKQYNNFKPTVVQTWLYHADLYGGVLSKLLGCQNVVWGLHHASLDPDSLKFSTRCLAKISSKLSAKIPRFIVSCSVSGVNAHKEFGYKGNFRVINNGYNFTKFKEDTALRKITRKSLDFCDEDFVIGMVARFDPQKDHENLLRSISSLKMFSQSKLVLVGQGITESNVHLVSLIKDHGVSDRVFLIGEAEDMPAIYNSFDLHVLSSFSEAFPNVIVEALACGVPCVGTSVGDIPYLLGDHGWVVSPRDHKQLGSAIASALQERNEHQEYWHKRKRCGVDFVNAKFSHEKMRENYFCVWFDRE